METKIDGNEVLVNALKKLKIDLLSLIAETSIWASPETCLQIKKKLGTTTRYPKVRRGKHNENKGDLIDGVRIDDNTYANNTIKNAIGIGRENITNFHACHIYPNTCYDVRYHTKIENLVLIPNSIAQLSDYFDDVKKILQFRSYELYCWYPEEEPKPEKPINYPSNWSNPIKCKKEFSDKDLEKQDLETNYDAEKNNYLDRESNEIEKVHRKIPKWLENKGKQINSMILFAFFELLEDSEFVSKEKLTEKCRHLINDFHGNFNQMAHFGKKNHAKIFEVNKDEVRLWSPVAKFIINSYNMIK